jgi:hypothetical protein
VLVKIIKEAVFKTQDDIILKVMYLLVEIKEHGVVRRRTLECF